MADRIPEPAAGAETGGGITVLGNGAASAAPNVFVARFAVQASRSSPSEAMDAASAALGRMRSVALELGATVDGMSSPAVSLRQDYDQTGRPSGFVADIALTVRSQDVPAAGALLTACIEAGGEHARLDSTSFEHGDPTGLLVAAREAAFGDAVGTARQLARLAGRRLGAVVSIDEGNGGGGPVPLMRDAMAVKAQSVPLEPGAVAATVTLVVRWAWAP